jgi:hypothetical protein
LVELRYCDKCGYRLPLGLAESDEPVCPGCGTPIAAEPGADEGSAGDEPRRQKPRTGHHRPVAGRRQRDIALVTGVAVVAGALIVVAALTFSAGGSSARTRPAGRPGPGVAATPGRAVKAVVPTAPSAITRVLVGRQAAKSAGPSRDAEEKAPGDAWTPREQPGPGSTTGMDKAEQEEYFAKVREEARKLPPPAVVPVAASSSIRPGGPTRVLSFTLINADTDLPIPEFDPLTDGATIDFAALPTRNLNVRANTSPSVVGSIRFGLDGVVNYQTESFPPYALGRDSSGDYNAWRPAPGTHTLTATPYGGSGASGEAGVALTIKFHVK